MKRHKQNEWIRVIKIQTYKYGINSMCFYFLWFNYWINFDLIEKNQPHTTQFSFFNGINIMNFEASQCRLVPKNILRWRHLFQYDYESMSFVVNFMFVDIKQNQLHSKRRIIAPTTNCQRSKQPKEKPKW